MAAQLTPERAEHRVVASLLEALDGILLAQHGVVFAGGTRIALAFGEYRVSRDADFLATEKPGYASLRAYLRESPGVAGLFRHGSGVELPREPRIDQYGIRFPVILDGVKLKVEFVAEGRIALSQGEPGPFSNVPWATVVDCFAEKLLANSDRWADDAYLSRDLIDLAALRLHVGPIPEESWHKARHAYGDCAVRDLERATKEFLRRDDHRARCFERLDVRGADQLVASVEQLLMDGR